MSPQERLAIARHNRRMQYDMDIGGYTTDAAIAEAEREFAAAEAAMREYEAAAEYYRQPFTTEPSP